jgi:hypothetical protein
MNNGRYKMANFTKQSTTQIWGTSLENWVVPESAKAAVFHECHNDPEQVISASSKRIDASRKSTTGHE